MTCRQYLKDVGSTEACVKSSVVCARFKVQTMLLCRELVNCTRKEKLLLSSMQWYINCIKKRLDEYK